MHGTLFRPHRLIPGCINQAEFIVQARSCEFHLGFVTHDLLLPCCCCYFLAQITFGKINLKACCFFPLLPFFFLLPAAMPEALMEQWNQAQTVTPLEDLELQIGQRGPESSGSDRGEMEEEIGREINGWMDGQADRRMVGRTDGWTHRQMNG